MLLGVTRGSQPQMSPPFSLPLCVLHTGLGCRDQARDSQCSGTGRHRTRLQNSQKSLLVQTAAPEREQPLGSISWATEDLRKGGDR